MICSSLHSIWMGASFTRFGLTTTLSTPVTPAASNSSTLLGRFSALFCISFPRNVGTTLITNSFCPRILTSVSFSVPSLSPTPGLTEIESIGGFLDATEKKLNGARFNFPDSDMVDTHAMEKRCLTPSTLKLYHAGHQAPIFSSRMYSYYQLEVRPSNALIALIAPIFVQTVAPTRLLIEMTFFNSSKSSRRAFGSG